MKALTRILSDLFLIYLALLISGCDREPQLEPIARIGDRSISQESFAFAYELAPRRITEQAPEKARTTVLENLINRILFSQEAERRGLDMRPRFIEYEDYYRRQAVNQELYRREVREKVTVDEEEERRAYERSGQMLLVKHFQSPDSTTARLLIADKLEIAHVPVHPWIETQTNDIYGAFDMIGWNTVDAGIEDVLYTLEPGQYSEPLYYGKQYHVFFLLDVIRDVMQRENDFQAQRESLHGVLRKRKEKTRSLEFVYDHLTPQQLIIRSDGLQRLTDYIWESRPQKRREGPDFIPDREIRLIEAGTENLADAVLAEYRDGTMDCRTFLRFYKLNPQKMDFSQRLKLLDDIQNMVGLYVRDQVLSDYGLSLGLDSAPAAKEDFEDDRDRLLAGLLQHELAASLATEAVSENPGDNRYTALESALLDSLRRITDIAVDMEVLMAIHTSDEGLSRKVDFSAIRMQ